MPNDHELNSNPYEPEWVLDSRDTYNLFYGTELTMPDSHLEPEQAARINEQFDIEVHLGTHGIIVDNTSEAVTVSALLEVPTQLEYQQVADLVGRLEVGDTLFVERYGFDRQPKEPIIQLESQDTPDADPRALLKAYVRSFNIEHDKKQVELDRNQYKIDAWEYAERLAIIKGIRVVRADCDAYDLALLRKHTGKQPEELLRSIEPQDQIAAKELMAEREQRACDIIKDHALGHLSDTPHSQSERKPKLVLLFGGNHEAGLAKKFGDMDLDTDFQYLESSENAARAKEQLLVQMFNFQSSLYRMSKNNDLESGNPSDHDQ